MKQETPGATTFDAFAADYDKALERGISVSGEDKSFFARGRLSWLAQRLRGLGVRPDFALDFGCGPGSATPLFFELLGVKRFRGVDVSRESLAIARRNCSSPAAEYFGLEEAATENQFDLAHCNGVFHHIPLNERDAAVRYVFRALRPGGIFAFWENNPWNPGTQYVMSRIPFDRDAVKVSVLQARRLLSQGGFEVLGADFHFVFPRFLGALRPLERHIVKLPIGAQYMVLCRKPSEDTVNLIANQSGPVDLE